MSLHPLISKYFNLSRAELIKSNKFSIPTTFVKSGNDRVSMSFEEEIDFI